MINKPHRHYSLILLFLLSFLAFGGQSAIADPVLNKPIYNPETKSYFELNRDRSTNGMEGPSWKGAESAAEKKYYLGAQGRLAIIASPETEMFIRTMLRPNVSAWIGIYFDCEIKSLKWSTGEVVKKGAYSNWDPNGFNHAFNGIFCPGNAGIMPALLAIKGESKYWAMTLPDKYYNDYIVEYPTGGVDQLKTPPKPVAPTTPPPVTASGHTSQNEE